MDKGLKTVLAFTLVYGLLAASVFAAQPTAGRTQMADGIRTIGYPQAFYNVQVASLDWHAN